MRNYLLVLATLVLNTTSCSKNYILAEDFERMVKAGGPITSDSSWPYKKLYTDFKEFHSTNSFASNETFLCSFCQTKTKISLARKKTTNPKKYIELIDYKMCGEGDSSLVKKTVLQFHSSGSIELATTSIKFRGEIKNAKYAAKHFKNQADIEHFIKNKSNSKKIYKGFYKRNDDDVIIIFQRGPKPTYAAVGFKGTIKDSETIIITDIFSKGEWRKLNYAYKGNEDTSGLLFCSFVDL